MSLIKKTLVLTGDKPKGYITVIRVGSEVGAKIVGETFNEKMRAYIAIGDNEQIEPLAGRKTELSLRIPLENADEVRCVVLEDREIIASAGRSLSKKEKEKVLDAGRPEEPEKEMQLKEPEAETEAKAEREVNFTEPTKEEGQEEAKEEKKKGDALSEEEKLLSGLRSETSDYYIGISDKVDELFVVYPTENNLCDLIPDSEWVKVKYEDDGYYVIGRLKDEGKVKYLGYGVPGVENIRPPKIADDIANWFPVKGLGEYDGYWIFFQDAQTGKIDGNK